MSKDWKKDEEKNTTVKCSVLFAAATKNGKYGPLNHCYTVAKRVFDAAWLIHKINLTKIVNKIIILIYKMKIFFFCLNVLMIMQLNLFIWKEIPFYF